MNDDQESLVNRRKDTPFRLVVLCLFLAALPFTVIKGDDRGWFTSADGWQGYELVFQWPLLIAMGVWFVTPVVIINANVLVGMWLRQIPKPVHIVAWSMAIPAILICLILGPVRPAFLLLALSWMLSGNGLLSERKARIKPTLST